MFLVAGMLTWVLPHDIGMGEFEAKRRGKCCRHCDEELEDN